MRNGSMCGFEPKALPPERAGQPIAQFLVQPRSADQFILAQDGPYHQVLLGHTLEKLGEIVRPVRIRHAAQPAADVIIADTIDDGLGIRDFQRTERQTAAS